MTRPSVAASAASLLGSRLTVALLAIVFLGVSTRLLTIEEMAVFALYNSLAGLVTVVCSLGLLAAAVRELPTMLASGNRNEVSGLIRLALAAQAGIGIVLSAVVGLLARPVSLLILKTPAYAVEVRLAAIAALGFGLHDALQLILNGLQRYDRMATNNVLTALLQRVLSLGGFFVFGLRGYLGGFAAGSFIGALLGAHAALDMMRARPALAAGWRLGQIRWAAPFYADGYLRYLYMQADQLVVGVFLMPAALSVYFIAKRFLQYCQMAVQSLLEPIGTRVAEMRRTRPSEIAAVYDRTATLMFVLFVPLASLLAASSPFLLRVLGGHRYDAGVAPLAFLMLSVIPYACFSHAGMFVFVLGDPLERFRTNLGAAIVQIGAMLLLVPGLALPGLAVARGLGFGAGTAWGRRILASDRLLGPDPHGRGAPWRRSRGMAAMLLAGLAGVLTALPWMLTGRVVWIPAAGLPAAALCAALFLRYILTQEDRTALAAAIPGDGRGRAMLRALIARAG